VDKTRTSQTLARGLGILNLFQEKNGKQSYSLARCVELGIKELQLELGLPKTVVSRLVTTLVEYGYLYQNPQTKKYLLGLSAYTLGLCAVPELEIRNVAIPFMERLASMTKETVSLNVVDPLTFNGTCISSIDSPADIKLTTRVGSVRPLHRGASRKVLLAYLESWQQEQYIARLSLQLSDEHELRTKLREIVDHGYAYSEQELDDGACAVAAPVLSQEGKLLAGIALAGPMYRMTTDRLGFWISKVKETAKEIALSLQSAPLRSASSQLKSLQSTTRVGRGHLDE
jgi:IclR family transcriptional regulator, KDG regulon repressor